MACFKGEVIADNSGTWAGNGLYFATEEEAQRYVQDLSWRWTLVRDTRVVQGDEQPNYTYQEGRLTPIKGVA